jgi:DNA-binding NtrC family response regulator
MSNGIVVLLGSLRLDRPAMDHLVSVFGYSVQEVSTLRHLENLGDTLVAVFFSPQAMGLECDEALQHVLTAAPGALPIVCHGFSETLDWPRLVDAGAFHSLPMPFSAAEIRQTLGFVWAAKSQVKSHSEAAQAPAPGNSAAGSNPAAGAAPGPDDGVNDASPVMLSAELVG